MIISQVDESPQQYHQPLDVEGCILPLFIKLVTESAHDIYSWVSEDKQAIRFVCEIMHAKQEQRKKDGHVCINE